MKEIDRETISSYYNEIKNGTKKVVFWGAGFWGTKFGYEEFRKRGIVPSFFCDNNKSLLGKQVVDGIFCEDSKRLVNEKDDVVCVITVAIFNMQKVIDQLHDMGIVNLIPYDRLFEFLDIKSDYFDFFKNDRIAVYTCITGDYDNVIEPIFRPDNYDYYLISEKRPINSIYTWINVEDVIPDRDLDPVRKNRYCKINTHKIFPKYRKSIYIDGNMVLKKSIDNYFDCLSRIRVGFGVKNNWSNIFNEAMSVTEQCRDNKDVIYHQVEKYWYEGMPLEFGGPVCNFIIREHNNPTCVKLMEDWWYEVKNNSKRDQLSFPYVLWKNGYSISDVFFVAESMQNDIWEFKADHNVPRINII